MEEAIGYVSTGIAIGLFIAGTAVAVYRWLKRPKRKPYVKPDAQEEKDVIPITRKKREKTNRKIWKSWNRDFSKRNA